MIFDYKLNLKNGYETKWNPNEGEIVVLKYPVNDKELLNIRNKYLSIKKEIAIEYLLEDTVNGKEINAFANRRDNSLVNISLNKVKNLYLTNQNEIKNFNDFKKMFLTQKNEDQRKSFLRMIRLLDDDIESFFLFTTKSIHKQFLSFDPMDNSFYKKETFDSFVEECFKLSKGKKKFDIHARAFEFLMYLHKLDYILFPQDVIWPTNRSVKKFDDRFISEKTLSIFDPYLKVNYEHKNQLVSLFLIAKIENIKNIEADFIEEIYQFMKRNNAEKSLLHKTFGLFKSSNNINLTIDFYSNEEEYIEDRFYFWNDLIKKYIENKFVKTKRASFPVYKWIDYLNMLDSPPLFPEEVERNEHIKNIFDTDKFTFISWLDKNGNAPTTNNNVISQVRQMFDFYKKNYNKKEYINPISEDDGFYTIYKSKTTKRVLPEKIINHLVEIVSKNNFEFPKTLRMCMIDKAYNYKLKKYETNIFYPGLSVLMILLLTIPIRSVQGRMLDSGIGDEYIYDFENNKMIKNFDKRAQKGRQQGVLQIINDNFSDKSFVSLWITTNKTADFVNFKGSAIPYCPKILMEALKIQKQWIETYGPNYKNPVNLSDMIVEQDLKPTEKMYKFMPSFFPLFPQVSHNILQKNTVIGKSQIDNFYYQCLEELEKKFNKENDFKIKLVRPRREDGGITSCIYSIHSLRASGITNLIAAKVPIEIISEVIAMHSTVLMTLYYSKSNISNTSEVLKEYYNGNSDENSYQLAQMVDFLLNQDKKNWRDTFVGTNLAKESLSFNVGLHEILLTGICPGISCEDANVGEKDCINCNYYITGPAFLPGQVAEANNLMIKIKNKGEELYQLRKKFIEEDNMLKLKTFESMAIQKEKELEKMMKYWAFRYEKIQKSIELQDDFRKLLDDNKTDKSNSNSLIPIFGGVSNENISLKIRGVSNFEALYEACKYMEFSPEFYDEVIALKLERFLSIILSKNGVEPFLFRLPNEQIISSMNDLSSILLEMYGVDGINELMIGDKKLDKQKISKLLPFLGNEERD